MSSSAHSFDSWQKLLVFFFTICLLVPVFFNVGSLLVPLYRIPLILLFIPLTGLWMREEKHITDFIVLGFCAWASLALFVNHRFSDSYQFVGFTWLETWGAYLVGRLLVRGADTIKFVIKLQLSIVFLLLPLAILETQTGDPIVILVLSKLVQSAPVITYPPRMGLERAQTVFQHPIIFGVFVASALAFVLNSKAAFKACAVTVCAICSASTAALLSLFAGVFLTAYSGLTQNLHRRWAILSLGIAMSYVVVDTISDRTPFHVFVSYLTLNSSTAFSRIQIWNWGMVNVLENPFVGLGLGEWKRAEWMSPSIDNFWLFNAVRFGIPAFLLIIAAPLSAMWAYGQLRLKPTEARLRQQLQISLASVLLAACTVHLWGPIYLWLFFLIGVISAQTSSQPWQSFPFSKARFDHSRLGATSKPSL